jgi:hypothetical protein
MGWIVSLLLFRLCRLVGETATHLITRLARCLAALLLVAGNNPAPRRALPGQRTRRTLGRVQAWLCSRFHLLFLVLQAQKVLVSINLGERWKNIACQ